MNDYQHADEITLVHSGEDYFRQLEMLLEAAKTVVHLQVYIFAADETGQRIAEALKRAAARGVDIWIVADEIGSAKVLNATFIEDLKKTGIRFRFFTHSFMVWNRHFGRTMHHKIAVADKNCALIGGINIADKYRGKNGATPWLDFAVLIRGTPCAYLHQVCKDIYQQEFIKTAKRTKKRKTSDLLANRTGLVRFCQNDWIRRKNEIYSSYLRQLAAGAHDLTLTATYFLPSSTFRKYMAHSIRRGRTVRVLLTGVSDIPLFRSAELYLQYWLLKTGVRVYLWDKSVLHGKAMLVDGQWASVGSYNINPLSRFRSIEMNAEILDPGFISRFKQYLDTLLETECKEILPESVQYANPLNKLWAWFSYHLVYYLFQLFFEKKMR
jgi:cardiolipin synthase